MHPKLRGRIRENEAEVIIEYHDSTPGFFWHIDGMEHLLTRLERGERNYNWKED